MPPIYAAGSIANLGRYASGSLAAVKVPHVRTQDGEAVNLLFADAGVHVLDGSSRPARLLRWSAGTVLIAFGLAAVGIGVSHAISSLAGLWLWLAAVVLIVTAGMLAPVAWALVTRAERRLRNGGAPPTIPAKTVERARSELIAGRVTVTLGLENGRTVQFSASGMAGTRLAHHFGHLLGVTQPAGVGPRAEPAGSSPLPETPRAAGA